MEIKNITLFLGFNLDARENFPAFLANCSDMMKLRPGRDAKQRNRAVARCRFEKADFAHTVRKTQKLMEFCGTFQGLQWPLLETTHKFSIVAHL